MRRLLPNQFSFFVDKLDDVGALLVEPHCKSEVCVEENILLSQFIGLEESHNFPIDGFIAALAV